MLVPTLLATASVTQSEQTMLQIVLLQSLEETLRARVEQYNKKVCYNIVTILIKRVYN
jgi:hypothetical protein